MMNYNMDFLVASLVILLIVLYHFANRKRLWNANSRIFEFFLFVGILDIMFDMITTILMSRTDGKLVLLTNITLTFFYILQDLISVATMWYTESLRDVPTESIKKSLYVCSIPAAIMGVFIILNFKMGIFFYFDQNGLYQKGPYYLAMYLLALGYVVVIAIRSIIHYQELGAKRFMVIWEFMIIEAACVLVQVMIPGLLFTGFGIGTAILVLYLTINNPNGYTDNLTGVFDKSSLGSWMQERIDKEKQFNIISIDLYKMKHINKVLGQRTGDKILVYIAGEIQKVIGSEQVFRITGNRFLLFVESISQYEKSRNALFEFFKEPVNIGEELLQFPAIICGITDAGKLKDSDVLLQYVEYLVSLAPDTEDTIVVQDNKHTMQGFKYEKEIEHFLNVAIEEDLFEVHYQPIFSTETQKYITMEALSRLRHPALGPVSPDVFISIAERSGRIADIGYLQFRRVCRFVKEHPELMSVVKNVKFNLSPLELLKQGQSQRLIAAIEEYGLQPSYFQFEITETVATEYSENLYRIAEEFLEVGIGLSLDDFGSGYANLNTVLKLPFSSIKLDRSLLNGILEDEQVATFYKNIVSLLHNMNYNIISEGVETKEEVDLLSGWGVNMIQGYYFSRPLNEKDLLKEVFSK